MKYVLFIRYVHTPFVKICCAANILERLHNAKDNSPTGAYTIGVIETLRPKELERHLRRVYKENKIPRNKSFFNLTDEVCLAEVEFYNKLEKEHKWGAIAHWILQPVLKIK